MSFWSSATDPKRDSWSRCQDTSSTTAVWPVKMVLASTTFPSLGTALMSHRQIVYRPRGIGREHEDRIDNGGFLDVCAWTHIHKGFPNIFISKTLKKYATGSTHSFDEALSHGPKSEKFLFLFMILCKLLKYLYCRWGENSGGEWNLRSEIAILSLRTSTEWNNSD